VPEEAAEEEVPEAEAGEEVPEEAASPRPAPGRVAGACRRHHRLRRR